MWGWHAWRPNILQIFLRRFWHIFTPSLSDLVVTVFTSQSDAWVRDVNSSFWVKVTREWTLGRNYTVDGISMLAHTTPGPIRLSSIWDTILLLVVTCLLCYPLVLRYYSVAHSLGINHSNSTWIPFLLYTHRKYKKTNFGFFTLLGFLNPKKQSRLASYLLHRSLLHWWYSMRQSKITDKTFKPSWMNLRLAPILK